MRSFEPLLRRSPGRRRRTGVAGGAAQLLGVPVTAAVPLQRHNPRLVLALSLAELASLVGLVATASLAALALLVIVSLALMVETATNRRQVLAFAPQGHVAMSASMSGWPQAVTGPLPRGLALPEPKGLGRSLELGGATWWVDRSAFRSLSRARELLQADGEDDGGE